MNMRALILAGFAVAALSGCATQRETNGALIGGGAGAVIGGVATHSVGGAVVGGAIGAVAGATVADLTGPHYHRYCHYSAYYGRTVCH
jgi:hypothetical protein